MTELQEVHIAARPVERFIALLGDAEVARVRSVAETMHRDYADRVIWNVNSTAVGGGVAEMLQSLIGYARSLNVDARWLVIEGSPDFFRVTKRIHHALHGARGSGEALDDAARRIYDDAMQVNARALCARVRPEDVVILHDPQTAGLAPALVERGIPVIWRCHIGVEERNAETEQGWSFLRPYLADVPALVFTREAYVPEDLDGERAAIIRPSIDAFSPKNEDLDADVVRTILVHTGLVEGPPPEPARHGFTRLDGSRGRVERRADVVRHGRATPPDVPMVVQVSRWDPLKDPLGVMRGFVRLAERRPRGFAQLVLAGPNVRAVVDDPEGPRVFEELEAEWRALPHEMRGLVHLAMLPTADVDENAAIVNALQRHAAVVVQKSLHEGFGLTVTEAMWKGRPVVASAVGGIRDQIEHGVDGLLLQDPADPEEFAAALARVLDDSEEAAALGARAKEKVRREFLGIRHLLQFADLIERVDPRTPA